MNRGNNISVATRGQKLKTAWHWTDICVSSTATQHHNCPKQLSIADTHPDQYSSIFIHKKCINQLIDTVIGALLWVFTWYCLAVLKGNRVFKQNLDA